MAMRWAFGTTLRDLLTREMEMEMREMEMEMREMEMEDSQTLTEFFKEWELVERKISSGAKATSDNYNNLVKNISANLGVIKESIGLLNQWKNGVAEVFRGLQPSVSKLSAISEGDAICELEHIEENVHEINNGTGQIVKLPRVELKGISKTRSKKRLTVNWKTTMLEETIMGSPAMAMARSTYDGLEDQLKLCFLSLSIFPENSIIRKRSLIYWWIGEGFVDAEKKAEECFEKLHESGLVETVEEQYSGSTRSCRLYPLIRCMAIEIANESMFFDFDSYGEPFSGPSHCTRRAFVAGTSGGGESSPSHCTRRAFVTATSGGGAVLELRSKKFNLKPEPSKLESLFNVDVNCIEFDEEDFRKLNKVKTLQLGRWITAPEHHIELLNPVFLNHLKQLKKLRYLGLQGISGITELADIQQLSELRVLDLQACHNLEKLPEEIAKLKKLTHLDVSKCYLLEHMPKGLGNLSELQLLNGFVVNTLSEKACQVSELTKLGNLEKLSISLGTKVMVKDGVLNPIGEIGKIEGLKSLRITWGPTPTEEENDDKPRKMETANGPATQSHSMLEYFNCFRSKKGKFGDGKAIEKSDEKVLFLPPQLTKLELLCYPEEVPPSLKKNKAGASLEKLYFRRGSLKSLRGLQRHDDVSKVRFIRLRFLKDLVMEKKDFEEEFPSLQIMQPYECPHIKYSLELVSRGGIRSPQWNDEASTSTSTSTNRST